MDILAVSCDSFDEETNKKIGRGQGNKNHVEKLMLLHDWCKQYKVAFKINTVVNTYNVDEDMAENICYLNPIRWKVYIYYILLYKSLFFTVKIFTCKIKNVYSVNILFMFM